ncbi:MAG: hypothetical protein ACFFFH_12125 [Candidatus Thorarchaeota archaeon]
MEQKKELNYDLISLKLPHNFINDFIEYWENVRKAIRPKGKSIVTWKKWAQIAQNLLEVATVPFYERWKHLKKMVWIEAYIQRFSSITLRFKGAYVLLPQIIIQYEAVRPRNTLLSSLKEEPTNKCLERILITLCGDLNIRLMKTDLKILQKLAQPRFSKSLDRYPKLKELAYVTRRDVRTISNRMEFLRHQGILSLIYLVDMARIGYQTDLIFHNKVRSLIPKELQSYIVLFSPLTGTKSFSTILQYPFRNNGIFNKLMTFFNPLDRIDLKNQYCGWNLSGLSRKSKERWKLLPPLLQDGGNWSKHLIIGETGVHFNLDPYYDPFPLSHRQGKLLAIIHKLATMNEEYLAKQLNVGRAYVTVDAQVLLRNKIIFRFPIFFNLGFGSWVYFCICDLKSNQYGGLLNVLEHLKFFPYVNVYYNLDEGTLIGRTRIPPSWTDKFIFSLTSLPSTFPESSVSHYIGPEAYAPWGFDILGTFDWDRHPK